MPEKKRKKKKKSEAQVEDNGEGEGSEGPKSPEVAMSPEEKARQQKIVENAKKLEIKKERASDDDGHI